MSTSRRLALLWGGLWLLTVAAGLALRPPLPVDETRYLSVAWEMWVRGDFLVPHLNGEPYSHKPPLLFWLMQAGWSLFGVVEWWPRLVAPLFALATLFLTRTLARDLWPTRPQVADWAPVLLVGSAFWALFQTVTMFDMLLAAFALMALIGLVRFWRDGRARWIGLAAVAIGLGVLAKGPAILLHVLPVALSAPLWAPRLDGDNAGMSWRRWYGGVALAVVGGAALALAWAVPAGQAGGEAYREAIFWGQSAGRMVKSFAHARPFWWYAAVLPGLLFPWVLWPTAWRALRRGRNAATRADGGVRLCLIWFGVAFLAFSVISGKQLHYLLPEFPALALVLAWLLSRDETSDAPARRSETLWPALPVMVVGLAILAVVLLPLEFKKPYWFDTVDGGWAVLAVVAGAVVAACWRATSETRLMALALLSPALVLVAHLGASGVLHQFYDLRPLARQLATWQQAGIAIGHFGKYRAEYHFLGRLKQPITVVGRRDGDQAAFLAANPKAHVVALHDRLPSQAMPLLSHPFRRRLVTVWDAATVVRNPGITKRN